MKALAAMVGGALVAALLPVASAFAAPAAPGVAAAAAAKSPTVRFVTLPGYVSPGTPAKYNKVGVIKTGKPSAKNVLLLIPGTSASAAYFEPLAKDIATRAPTWQVWSVERRENLLEDQQELRIRTRYSMKKNTVDP